jgi:hypothetical protein
MYVEPAEGLPNHFRGCDPAFLAYLKDQNFLPPRRNLWVF